MPVPEIYKNLVGVWHGTNRLHTVWTPETPIRDSESEATVELIANENFVKLDYDWVYEGNIQHGMLLVSIASAGTAETAWVDSFHSSGSILLSKGQFLEMSVDVSGTYSVPGHPDWGWRTVMEKISDDEFSITMYNLSPEGEQYDAVEFHYRRK